MHLIWSPCLNLRYFGQSAMVTTLMPSTQNPNLDVSPLQHLDCITVIAESSTVPNKSFSLFNTGRSDPIRE